MRAWLAMDWLIRQLHPDVACRGRPMTVRRRGCEHSSLVLTVRGLHAALEPLAGVVRGHEPLARRPWVHRAPRCGHRRLVPRMTAREIAWESAAAAPWSAARLGIGDIAGDRACGPRRGKSRATRRRRSAETRESPEWDAQPLGMRRGHRLRRPWPSCNSRRSLCSTGCFRRSRGSATLGGGRCCRGRCAAAVSRRSVRVARHFPLTQEAMCPACST